VFHVVVMVTKSSTDAWTIYRIYGHIIKTEISRWQINIASPSIMKNGLINLLQ
jgi:hypothetical protein